MGVSAVIGVISRAGGDPDDTISIISHTGGLWIYLLVFALILIQELGVPLPVLPSEIVLLCAGFLASQGRLTLLFMGLLATCATLIGNSVLYYVSRRYGRAALDRYGKHVFLRPERVNRIEAWMERRGTPILVYGPLLPIMRAYVPALAGLFGVPYKLYIFVLTGAAVVWTFSLLILGQMLGEHWWDAALFFRHNLRAGVLIAVAFAVVGALILRQRRRRAARGRQRTQLEAVVPPAPPLRARANAVHRHGTGREFCAED